MALVLGLAAVLVLPGSASATVTMTDFKVEPSSKQGGGHPSVTITQSFSYDNNTDSVKDAFVRLQPGLLGNPQSAAMCTQAQFQADHCPADSKVGSVVIDALAYPALAIIGVPTTSNGVVYNMKPTGDEPARVGIVVNAAGNLSKIFLQAPVYVRPGPDGYGLESTFADQPRNAGVPLQITKIALTFDARGSKGPFMRMPTSCAEGTSVSRANSWDAPAASSQKEFRMTPTGCDALGFSATAAGSMGAPGITDAREFPPVTTTLRFNPEEAALKRAEVILPISLGPNLSVTQRACSRPDADASSCPASSRVGTAIIDSPLQATPVQGPVYIAYNTSGALPGLIVMLPPPVGVRLDGAVDLLVNKTQNTFASNPDLPVRSFTLSFDGGPPDSALVLTQDLCAEKTDLTMHVKLTAHNGKETAFAQELATPGCDPRAKVSLRRRAKLATLVARVTAARDGPGVTGVTVRLPKSLRRGKPGAIILAGGRKLQPLRTGKRRVSIPFAGDGVRSARIVWRGLRTNRKLKRTARIAVSIKDARGHTTALKPRVQVRGKRPKHSR
ncbi:MAG TPA: hypothetical protein VK486_13020 [Thermoleophilaceae bacterium]|nr:hypothetical protein [Thermoleophilaceae bacterium]